MNNKNIYHSFSIIIKSINSLLEIFLGIRVVLKFFGASSKASIVDTIYKFSDLLISPFKSIFPNIYLTSGMIDMVAISAMIGYLILTFIIIKILQLIFLRHKTIKPEQEMD
ncbi:YggT family protein [Candidatus Wolfebacteria bacterium]|nr:YggT family protein [Candidatus Wolfebacteria bacterium]